MIVRRVVVLLIATVSIAATACGTPGPAATAGPPTTLAPPSASPLAKVSPSAAPSPSISSAAFHVVGLTLKASPADPIGACPVKIAFSGEVTTVGGTGTVSFQWVSSDGDRSPVKTIDFGKSAVMDISSDWTVDPVSLPTHAGWSSIEILGPPSTISDAVTSARADFVFTCDQDTDIEMIGFGIGGSDADCSIKTPERTFSTTDPIRMVATWSPSLVKGTVVTVTLTRNGEVVDGYPVSPTFNESTRCIHGLVSQHALVAGHYRFEAAPDTARSVAGEFDVK
jgi:hypothetical protein